MGGYVWDDSCVEDRPLKIEDHAEDAFRYWVKTMKLLKPQTKYKPIWN
jgi:hypothetical protein